MDFLSGWCKSKRKLQGSTAIITGCNTGIGKETALDLYKRGAKVIMACRNVDKAEKAKKEIEDVAKNNESNGSLLIEELDLSKLKSIKKFVARLLATEANINILINNAGVMMCPEGKTEDGFETHMGTNHLGHALLTLLLLPKLVESGPSRIVIVTSYLHKNYLMDLDDLNFEKSKYDPLKAYSLSKAANVLFTKALAIHLQRHDIKNVTTYSVHPGIVRTEISRHFSVTAWYGATWAFNNIMGLFLKSAPCGAQTSIYCAVDEACAEETGLYYSDCHVATTSEQCADTEFALKFFDQSLQLLNIKDDPIQNIKNHSSTSSQ